MAACADGLLDGRTLHAAVRSLFVVCLLAAACTGASLPPAGAQEQALDIHSRALHLKIDEPAATQRRPPDLARRHFDDGPIRAASAAGRTCTSRPTAKTLTSISDEGGWLTATIDYDADGNLAGLSGGRIGKLHGLDGKPLDDKAEADAEGMARLPDGSWLVAFERHHRLWRYPTLASTRRCRVDGPADIGRQPANGGIEALTALADGRIIAISEEYSLRPGTVVGWIGQPAKAAATPGARSTTPRPPTSIRRRSPCCPTDRSPRIERAFDMVRGVRCRVMRFDAAAAQARRHGARRGAGLARLALCGRQSGRVGRDQGARAARRCCG